MSYARRVALTVELILALDGGYLTVGVENGTGPLPRTDAVDQGVGAGVEIEDDGFAAQIREGHVVAVLIGQREVRCRVPLGEH